MFLRTAFLMFLMPLTQVRSIKIAVMTLVKQLVLIRLKTRRYVE